MKTSSRRVSVERRDDEEGMGQLVLSLHSRSMKGSWTYEGRIEEYARPACTQSTASGSAGQPQPARDLHPLGMDMSASLDTQRGDKESEGDEPTAPRASE